VAEGLRHFPSSRVELKMVKIAVGPVTESDIFLAKNVGASVLAFNVGVDNAAVTAAAHHGVYIRIISVITYAYLFTTLIMYE